MEKKYIYSKGDVTSEFIMDLDEREEKLVELCLEYGKDPFGAPNHLFMVLVDKLWNYIIEQNKVGF